MESAMAKALVVLKVLRVAFIRFWVMIIFNIGLRLCPEFFNKRFHNFFYDSKKFDVNTVKDFLTSFEFVRCGIKAAFVQSQSLAETGNLAPNPKIIDLKSGLEKRLLDYNSDSKPLVWIFGSCT